MIKDRKVVNNVDMSSLRAYGHTERRTDERAEAQIDGPNKFTATLTATQASS